MRTGRTTGAKRPRPCEGCKHYRRLSMHGGDNTHACHYAIDTGRMRGGTTADCTKQETQSARAAAVGL